jgi:hypothetical protein
MTIFSLRLAPHNPPHARCTAILPVDVCQLIRIEKEVRPDYSRFGHSELLNMRPISVESNGLIESKRFWSFQMQNLFYL